MPIAIQFGIASAPIRYLVVLLRIFTSAGRVDWCPGIFIVAMGQRTIEIRSGVGGRLPSAHHPSGPSALESPPTIPSGSSALDSPPSLRREADKSSLGNGRRTAQGASTSSEVGTNYQRTTNLPAGQPCNPWFRVSGMADELETLHHDLFGFIPKKPGTSYERLAAVVLAVLGWQVTHDVKAQPIEKAAGHQLDVVARAPDGHVKRLVIECKDYAKTVEQGVLDTLVGVRQQVGADAAAVVTTIGFSAGARAVASDEDIALLRLRHFDPATEKGKFVMKVILKMGVLAPPHRSNFDVEVAPSAGVHGSFDFALTGEDRLSHLDGTPAETLAEVIAMGGAASAKGVYTRRVDFPDERVIQSVSGTAVAIKAMTWTETVDEVIQTITTEKKGTPVLVLEQLNSDGSVSSGRLVVSEDLDAWDIDSQGVVHERGKLV